MNIKFGLALDFWSPTKPLSRKLDDYLGLLSLGEQYGFDSVWAGEGHLQEPAPNHVPSPLLVLAALARSTRLRLGTGVTLLPLWHPLRLAHEAALLDQISEGRLILGVAIGHRELMVRYGVPPDEVATRMDEILLVLKKLWRGEDEHRGRHFNIDGRVYPGPVQPGGPPLWVGGNIRRSVERAALLGDGWYGATEYHFDAIKRQARRYREMLKARHKDRPGTTICINRVTFLAETDKRACSEAKAFITPLLNFYASIGHLKDAAGTPLEPQSDYSTLIGDEFCFVGSPESCLRSIRKYRDEADVNHINFRVSFGDMPVELATRTVMLLGESVLPQLSV